MKAYEKAQEYSQAVGERLEGLKIRRAELQAKADGIAQEMTTAAGLLSEGGGRGAELKDIRADIAAIDDQIRAIDAAGGLEGILRGDDHMKELAADAYAEEMKALDSLENDADALAADILKHLERFAEFQERAEQLREESHRREGHINALRPFVGKTGELSRLSPKTPYRRHTARLPRRFSPLFADIRQARESLERETAE